MKKNYLDCTNIVNEKFILLEQDTVGLTFLLKKEKSKLAELIE